MHARATCDEEPIVKENSKKYSLVTKEIFVGLDVHKADIQMAVVDPSCADILESKRVHTEKGINQIIRELRRAFPEAHIQLCYEAGPTGYGLSRRFNAEEGFQCRVIAPSMTPRKPGERVKTDRRDARKLAKFLRAGLLTEVHAPGEDDEALREVSRARQSASKDVTRAKQKLSKFMLRHGRRFSGSKSNWTQKHYEWLEAQRFEQRYLQYTFDTYLRTLTQANNRLKELDRILEEASRDPSIKEPIELLKCFKGVKTVTAMALATELYDFYRFDSPTGLMCFLGMTPSEHSSGQSQIRGGITKAGNTRIRRLLVEATRNVVRSNKTGRATRRRRRDKPGWAIDIAEKAQVRLHHRYWSLVSKGKQRNKAIMAVAREFVGFIWAMLAEYTQRSQQDVA